MFQAICRIGIFMICAQAILHFRPEESYEKYLKLLVSVMILIQLFLPVGRFLFHGGSETFAGQLELFKESLESGLADAEERALEAETLLEQMTLEEVRRRAETTASQEETQEESTREAELSGARETENTTGGITVELEPVEEIRIGF